MSSQITELELYFELAEWNTKRTAVQNIIKHQNLKTTKKQRPGNLRSTVLLTG